MIGVSRRTGIAVVAVIALVGIAANPAAEDPQRTFTETPQFIPTAVTVTGRVSVDNSPTVQAQQAGEWRVSMARPPIVYWRPPPFVEAGRTYRVTLPALGVATYRIVELGFNGWVRVEPEDAVPDATAGAEWLNLDRASFLEEVLPVEGTQ